jgi:hypothetical protein
MVRRIILIVGMTIILLGIAAFLFYSVYSKAHVDYGKEDARMELTAEDLFQLFASDPSGNPDNLLNKVVTIFGEITDIQGDQFILENHIVCTFGEDPNAHLEDFAPATTIKIKGRIVSFDHLLGEVRMDHCMVLWE